MSEISPWRALLMVHHDDVDQMDAQIQKLKKLGITDIDIFAQAGVRISMRYDHATHQSKEWTTPFRLWQGALELAGKVYASRTDLFLVLRPGCYLWEQTLVWCEYTVKRDVVGIWSLLTPNRIFPSENDVKPSCKTRRRPDNDPPLYWCQTYVTPDVGVHHCFVMTGHMLALTAAYLPKIDADIAGDEMRVDGMQIGSVLSMSLGRRRVPYYFSHPSLAQVEDVNYLADDFIGVAFHMPQKGMRDDIYVLESRQK